MGFNKVPYFFAINTSPIMKGDLKLWQKNQKNYI